MRFSFARALWSPQIPDTKGGLLYTWVWWGLSVLLVALAPSQLLDGQPFWSVPSVGLSQSLLAAAAFLILTLWMQSKASRSAGVSLLGSIGVAIICYGAVYVIHSRVRPEMLNYSRGQFVLSGVLGVALALLPQVLSSWLRPVRLTLLAAALGVVIWLGLRPTLMGTPEQAALSTALKPLTKIRYSGLLPPVHMGRGGAIEPLGNSFLLVTGDGDFYVLDWQGDVQRPRVKRVAMSLPPDPGIDTAAPSSSPARRTDNHRVLDMKVDTTASPSRVLVSSQEWLPAADCFTVRVSVGPLELLESQTPGPAQAWTKLFETSPCVPASSPQFAYLEAGGRLALLGDSILLTVGDFGLAQTVRPPPPQSAESPYGKVLLIDRSGHHTVFTMGHRNPQGLLVDNSGRIWLTEHGPQGGDELNLLERGRNYGYPLATYGTTYGRYEWPLAPRQQNHGDFTEPVEAFVPSVAISNLIQIESPAFVEWQHDLLIGSLHRTRIYRARLRDDRVLYVEPIFVGARVRDLAEAGGRIVIWTDSGRLVSLTPGPALSASDAAFGRCRSCHESSPEGPASGPSLRGVIGARIARDRQYPYSPVLRQTGGAWTEERLDAFLRDPNAFAPGSDMAAGQVQDDEERRTIIEFLKTYR